MRPIEGEHTAPELDNGGSETLDEMRKLVINQTLYKNEDGPAPGQQPTLIEKKSTPVPKNTNVKLDTQSLGGLLEQSLQLRGEQHNKQTDEEAVQSELIKERLVNDESLRMTENIMARLMR